MCTTCLHISVPWYTWQVPLTGAHKHSPSCCVGSCFFIGGLRQWKGGCLLYDMLYTTNLSSSMLLAAIMLAPPSWSAIAQGHSFMSDRHAILVRAVAIILILL